MNIVVLGVGNWGTALGNHLAKKGFSVIGITDNAHIAESINKTHRNPLCLSEFLLEENFLVTTDTKPASEAEVVLVVVPSSVLPDALKGIFIKKDAVVVSAIKGFIRDTLLTPLQYCRTVISNKLAVISGPSFAKDIISGKPAGVVSASEDESTARQVAEIFGSSKLKVYVSTDPLGVELGAAVKNVISIAAGVSDGLGFGESARAGIITRGLAEMMRLAQAMGADLTTLSGLSGLGDLAMTASSELSRNHTVGLRLGKGESLDTILNSLGSVSEGVSTAPLVLELAKKYKVEMPISSHVDMLIKGRITPKEMADLLMSRPLKKEFD